MSRLGIDGFEQLVPEGIPKTATVLVLVPPAEEKDQLAAQFLAEGLKNGDAAIVLESDAGIRDLVRRLGNLGVDAEKATTAGRFIPLDWAKVAARKKGAPSGLPAVEAALSAAAVPAKVFPGLRVVIGLSGTLAGPLASLPFHDLTTRLSRAAKALGGLSVVLAPRAQGAPPAVVEGFDLVLDLRPLIPSGVGLAVIAIGGTPLPRSHLALVSVEGRLAIEAPKKAAAPAAASIECPVCKSIIPAGAAECPVCKSPRPVRRPGEPEVLDYIEALGQRVGLPGAPLEPPPPAPTEVPPPPPAGKEAMPARPEPPRRGLTNGLAQRRKMPASAAPRGRVNGQGRVNGLTSSIISTRSGMTNGLTNGNGFTNGLGARRFVSENRLGAWRVWIIPIVAAALLSVPLLFSVELTSENRFGIDGSFGEWTTRVPLATDLSLPGSVDLVSAAIRDDADRVYGFLQTREPLLQGSPDHTETDALRMFIDSDEKAASGYAADGIGADILVEITGSRGAVVGATVSSFPPTGDTSDWTRWIPSESPLVAVGRGAEANKIEFAFSHLAGRNGSSLRATFESLSYAGQEDTSGFALSPGRGTVVVAQRSIAPANITSSSADLLGLDLRVPVGTADLASLRVSATGTLPRTAVEGATLLDASGATAATAAWTPNGFNFVLSPARSVPASGTTFRVSVQANMTARGTLGLMIDSDADVHLANNATVSLSTIPAARDVAYVGPVPVGVTVDGGFEEWPRPMPDDSQEPSTLGNANIDIAAYDSIRTATAVAVYAGVAGRILQGALVPARNPDVPKVAPLDSDRDGVPDTVEATLGPVLPFDFNNDNVSDANSNGDRDGDGIKDAPAGPDLWLNTTIPLWYPAPYTGRPVSVYIGPVQRPVSRGEDTLRVFIDSDANPATGYAVTIGADWMVEVAGRHGVARTQGLFRFTGGTPGEWSWSPQGAVDVAVGTRQLELLASLTSAPVAGTQILIDLRDWNGAFDESGVATRGTTRSATGGSVDGGEYTATLPEDPTGATGFQVSTDRFTATWRLAGVLVEDGGVQSLPVAGGPPVMGDSIASYALRVGTVPASLRYSFGPGSIKEEFILSGPPANFSPTGTIRVRFALALSGGAALTPLAASGGPRSGDGGGDFAISVDGEVAARFPSPFAIDGAARVTPCGYEIPSPDALDIACPGGLIAGGPYPVTIDPSTVFALSNNGPDAQAGENLGWVVASGDFNGDGRMDILTGAPLHDTGPTVDTGIAYIYLGPFSGDVTVPSVALKGNGTTLYRAGYAVAAGDFNNDGYDDAVVGQQNGGPTLLFYGRASWPASVSTANVSFPVPSPTPNEVFGRALAVGNFDGSGGVDLVIGRPLYPSATTNPHGRAYLYFSPFTANESTPDLTLAPFNDTKGRFGWSLAAGRIDSDTRDDLIVGEITVTAGTSTFGRLSLFKGSSLTGSGTKKPDTIIINLVTTARFGNAVAVGRLNGDSYADVLVGSPIYSSNNGRAYVFLAKSDGTGLATNQTPDLTISNQASGEKFGSSVLIADYWGDGTGDAIIGAPGYNTDQGRVYAFNNPFADLVPDETFTGASADEQLGNALGGGKGSGDPRFVLAIGGPFWDDVSRTDAGRAIIATIPEFPDMVIVVVGIALVVIAVRPRRKLAS